MCALVFSDHCRVCPRPDRGRARGRLSADQRRIAASSNSGNMPGEPHLHFEVCQSWPATERFNVAANFANAQGPSMAAAALCQAVTTKPFLLEGREEGTFYSSVSSARRRVGKDMRFCCLCCPFVRTDKQTPCGVTTSRSRRYIGISGGACLAGRLSGPGACPGRRVGRSAAAASSSVRRPPATSARFSRPAPVVPASGP